LSGMIEDIAEMHEKFGVNETVRNFSSEKLQKFLEFRIDFLQEELTELRDAEGAEDVVDALIDLIVVAIGTLNAFDVDTELAWNAVHAANMSKEPGIKPERPNPLGLPDLIKPDGWQVPSHHDNYGLLADIYESRLDAEDDAHEDTRSYCCTFTQSGGSIHRTDGGTTMRYFESVDGFLDNTKYVGCKDGGGGIIIMRDEPNIPNTSISLEEALQFVNENSWKEVSEPNITINNKKETEV